MVDANVFFTMLLCILGSILLIALIVLVVKMIFTVDKVNKMLDEISNKFSKFDKMFEVIDFTNANLSKFEKVFDVVDLITDNMAFISDRVADNISNFIRRIFGWNRKEEIKDENEQ